MPVLLRAFGFAALLLTLTACAAPGPRPPAGLTVTWSRYTGTWYELARFDHSFERDLVGVTATYRALPDDRIEVINAGHRTTLDGPRKEARASAVVTGPASLSVTFFWPFSGDYRVLALDPDYRWAVVGSSSTDYLWFLHRAPQASPADWEAMNHAATAAGLDLTHLIRVAQPTTAP